VPVVLLVPFAHFMHVGAYGHTLRRCGGGGY
jgi:hypothetical protein